MTEICLNNNIYEYMGLDFYKENIVIDAYKMLVLTPLPAVIYVNFRLKSSLDYFL